MEGDATPALTLELGKDECLVLFEMLSRTFQNDKPLEAKYQGELQALSKLQGLLEKQLVEPFDPNYLKLVDDARQRLVVRYGEFQAD